MLEDLSIVIFTHNRQHYLKRVLSYYKPYDIKIIIVDSTKSKADQSMVRAHNIIYLHRPDEVIIKKLKQAVAKVQTEYMAFCADDDFAIPRALSRCVEFLRENTDYVTALGNFAFFKWENNTIRWKAAYHVRESIDNSSAHERFIETIGKSMHFQLLYSVCRTGVMQKIYEDMPMHSNTVLHEHYVLALLSIYGKVKHLPIFYGAREEAANAVAYELMKFIQMKDDVKYKSEYQDFIDTLVNAIEKVDRISKEDAADYVMNGMDDLFKKEKRSSKVVFSGRFFDRIKMLFPRLLYVYRVIHYGKATADLVSGADRKEELFGEGFPYYNEETMELAKEIEQMVCRYPVEYKHKHAFKVLKRTRG